jgi:Zn-dependent peptidase ImmA (M78 family)
MKKSNLLKYLRSKCQQSEVLLRIQKFPKNDIHGLCYLSGKTIAINKAIKGKAELARTVFHELAHAECIKKGKYKEFHTNTLPPAQTFYYENKVEHLAKKNWDKAGMRKLFGQYQFYYSKKDKKDVINWIKSDQ